MSIVAIAKAVGVSKSTVSRVINDVPGVRPEIAKAVREQMDQVGYRPPARRRGPKPASRRGIRTGNLLFLMLGYNSSEFYRAPVFPRLLHGLETAVRDAGLNLVLASADPSSVVPASLSGSQVDGVLIVGRARSMSRAVAERIATLPVVLLMRSQLELSQSVDRVLYNNEAIGTVAANHLIGRGHRHLAFISAMPSHDAFITRHQAFVKTARKAQAQISEIVSDHAALTPPDATHSAKLAKRLSGMSDRPTGAFVPTDALVPDLYTELRRCGIEPGRDLDIVSCDNEPQFLDQLEPRPTSIDINLELVARRGVEQLLWRVANNNHLNSLSIYVEPRIIEPGLAE